MKNCEVGNTDRQPETVNAVSCSKWCALQPMSDCFHFAETLRSFVP